MGIQLMPSQVLAGRYLYAIGRDGNWLYPEVAKIVARQNGKTELLKPHVCTRLRQGRRIMHSAQNRELPREVFGHIAEHMQSVHFKELAKPPRFANGQEEILTRNHGRYRIVAPTRGGARGPANDDLILDEVRELDTLEFPAAANPTLSAAPNPQTFYLSNMGDDSSVVLNALRQRSIEDPALAYLEWSAGPDRKPDDQMGWLEANPSVGHLPGKMRNLEREYESHRLGGTMTVWETEYLCRPVVSMRERLVHGDAWAECQGELGKPVMPYMAISMDPSGTRASAAIAWAIGADLIGLQMLMDVTGDPLPLPELGEDMRKLASRYGAIKIGFDPITDAELAKFMPKPAPITGRLFANASARFVTAVEGREVRWSDAAAVTEDLPYVSRKKHTDTNTFEAVRAVDARPVTAVMAAIRAVWLASGPRATTPRIF